MNRYYRLRHKPTGLFIEKNELKKDPKPYIKKPNRKKFGRLGVEYKTIIPKEVLKTLTIWYSWGMNPYMLVGTELDEVIEKSTQGLGLSSAYTIEINSDDLEIVEYELIEMGA